MAASSTTNEERRHLLSPSSSHSSSAVRSGAENDDEDTSMTSSSSCRHCMTSYVPIEPLLFCYTFSRITVSFLTGFYFFDQASHMYGDPSMDSLNPCGKNHSGSAADKAMAENVQQESLQLSMIAAFSGYMTALLPAVFLGPLTDKLGRRPGLVLPVLGTLLRAIVFLFVLGTGASLYFVYIGTVLEGLGGGFGTFFSTTFSATADVTNPGRQRSMRICIIEAVNVFASALATFSAGQWRLVSYTQPVILAACLGLACLVYTLWVWPETHTSSYPQATPSQIVNTSQAEDPSKRDSVLRSYGNVGPQAGQERRVSTGQTRPQSSSQGVMEHVGINNEGADRVLTRGRGGEGSRKAGTASANQDIYDTGTRLQSGANNDGEIDYVDDERWVNRPEHATPGREDKSGTQTHQTYISFSPTGHRLSNAVGNHGSWYTPMSAGTRYSRERVIPETPEAISHNVSCCSLALSNVKKSVSIYFRSDDTSHPARRCVLVLCFVCFLLTVAVNFSKPSVETVFRMGQLCWNAVDESRFDSGWLVQHWIFIFVVLHVLQGRYKVRNVVMAMIGCTSAICAPFIFSFATLPDLSDRMANILVFVSAGSGTLARLLIPMLRSMSSSAVHLDEQGSLFASYAVVELAGAAVFDMAASQVYKATVHGWKGVVFIIMTVFFIVVMILLVILSVVQRRVARRNSVERTRIAAYESISE